MIRLILHINFADYKSVSFCCFRPCAAPGTSGTIPSSPSRWPLYSLQNYLPTNFNTPPSPREALTSSEGESFRGQSDESQDFLCLSRQLPDSSPNGEEEAGKKKKGDGGWRGKIFLPCFFFFSSPKTRSQSFPFFFFSSHVMPRASAIRVKHKV